MGIVLSMLLFGGYGQRGIGEFLRGLSDFAQRCSLLLDLMCLFGRLLLTIFVIIL